MATLNVGPGQTYATIAAAIAASADGDTVLVQAGTYVNDFATIYHKITLKSVGGLAIMDATVAPPNGKAILTTETDVTIDGFGFTGAAVGDNNGAGIRYEGGNLTVKNSVFWNNQDGILANDDPTGNITIDSSEFSHNGAGDGYSHGIYINHVNSLVVTNSYFHDAQVGHEIKSRAANTTITGNRIFDNALGTASYSIDLPNGGNAVISNNVIEKGPDTENPFTIHFGGEPGVAANSSLTVTNNTIVNDRTGGTLLLNQTSSTAVLANNSIYGFDPANINNGPATITGMTTLTTRPTLNLSTEAPAVVPNPPAPTVLPALDVSSGTTFQDAGAGGAVIASGRILTVGPTGQFRTLMSAVAASRDGDTIQVAAGTYVNDFADINHKIIIEGVGGIAKFVQTNDLSRMGGIFVANTDATIRNVELTGAINYPGLEAGLYVAGGNVTLVNSTVDGNNVGVAAADNANTNLSIYNSDLVNNSDVAKGTNNVTVGAINSLTIRNDYLAGADSGHEIFSRAFNTDVENSRIVDGSNVAASFLIDLGLGGNAIIRNNLLVKGAQAANGVLIHVGGEGTPYANSNVVVDGNQLVTQYQNSGHPYTYFVVGDSSTILAPITATNNTFQGGVAGSAWLVNATDGGGNSGATTTTVNTNSAVSTTGIPAMFAAQGGHNVLTLGLSEKKGDVDAQFTVAIDGNIVGGGVVTAIMGTSIQNFSFAGDFGAGTHTIAVNMINMQTGAGGGAYNIDVNSVGLDGVVVHPNAILNPSNFSTTITNTPTLAGFDPAYYLAMNPDVAKAGIDPLTHYLTYGWHEGRNPSAMFDTNYYLTVNPDVAKAGVNPLLHYDTYGYTEGRDPSLLFSDTAAVAKVGPGVNPLDQYLVQGRFDGVTPTLAGGTRPADILVDTAYYDRQLGASLLPTGTAANQQAAWSYDTIGWQHGLNPNAWFDTNYYLSHNPDVAAAHIDPLLHYETYGWKEGRDPSAIFSTNKYLAAYSDVAKAGMDPLVHFVQYGQAEGRTAFAV